MRPGQRGSVLLAVLWICGVIMWVAFMIAADQKLKAEGDILAMGRTQGLHLAVGGAYEALARMVGQAGAGLSGTEQALWRPDGVAREVRYPRGRAMVRVETESAKVNVNTADVAALVEVFQKAGLTPGLPEILADRILDFRDPDEVRLPNGAEKEEYKALGLDYFPLDEPLKSLDQLLLVPGVSPDLFYTGARPRQPRPGESGDASPPGRSRPLWTMLTAAQTGLARLPENKDDKSLPFAPPEEIRKAAEKAGGFQGRELYRIVSVGQVSDQAPAVTLWMIVRLGGGPGYEVLFRKIL